MRPPLAHPGLPAMPSAGEQMEPPAPFPPWPGPAAATPAVVAALARQLAARGITGIYTATTYKFAVISVTASLTVWTNGQQLWSTRRGDLRGHQPRRPGHAGQPAAGKGAPGGRGADLRDQ
jgi:hypothetical protein